MPRRSWSGRGVCLVSVALLVVSACDGRITFAERAEARSQLASLRRHLVGAVDAANAASGAEVEGIAARQVGEARNLLRAAQGEAAVLRTTLVRSGDANEVRMLDLVDGRLSDYERLLNEVGELVTGSGVGRSDGLHAEASSAPDSLEEWLALALRKRRLVAAQAYDELHLLQESLERRGETGTR